MTRVLFCVIPEKGHVNPMIGPAQALQSSGAEVVFHAPADIAAQLAGAGITRFIGPATPALGELHRGAAFAERVRDAAWLRQWIKAMLVESVPDAVQPLRAILREVRPDVVAIDPMYYAAVIACELEHVPWAAVSNSLNPALPADIDSELLQTVAWLAPERDELFARYGLTARFRGCDVLSPHLTIAFTTDAFVGNVPGVNLVGPSLPRRARGDETAFPWDWLDRERPLIYVSFGSQIYYQPALFRRVLDAVARRPVQLVASASELASSRWLGTLPTNALMCPYVPQLELLSRASAMITHGGANSVMEAIAWCVPLLVMPLCNDQFHQAELVTRANIGRRLDADRASAVDIGLTLDALLSDGDERRNLALVSATYQRDGAAETARLLTQLAARNRPVRAS